MRRCQAAACVFVVLAGVNCALAARASGAQPPVYPDSAEVAAQPQFTTPGLLMVGPVFVDPKLHIDSNQQLLGLPVHYFTSRPLERKGFSMNGVIQRDSTPHWGFGLLFGFEYWSADYWLNWEVPGTLALDPLPATFKLWAMETDGTIYRRFGPGMLQSRVGIFLGWTNLSVDLGDEDPIMDNVFSTGVTAGGDFYLNISGNKLEEPIALTVGYKLVYLIPHSPRYTVEDGVFDSSFDGPAYAIFVGIGRVFPARPVPTR